MKGSQKPPPKQPPMGKGRRLFLSLCPLGCPQLAKTRASWLFLITQFAFYLYMFGPVFVNYIRGVPFQDSLD